MGAAVGGSILNKLGVGASMQGLGKAGGYQPKMFGKPGGDPTSDTASS